VIADLAALVDRLETVVLSAFRAGPIHAGALVVVLAGQPAES
jgi:hypothetical protein